MLENGDPETPTWPSLPNSHRISFDEIPDKTIPKIVAQPIGYDDAREIFRVQKLSPNLKLFLLNMVKNII